MTDNQAERFKDLADENNWLRASLANSGGPCPYCALPKAEWSACANGFPGCPRGDDAMLCPNVGASLEAEDRIKELEAQVEALRKDAERYRWLRDDIAASAVPRVWSSNASAKPVLCLHAKELDSAIDEAMKGQS